jgi:hypothetical protein
VHGADHTGRHPTSQSSGHQVSDLWLTIIGPLHQVSYSCYDHRRCPPCRTCHLHTTRQANAILHTNQGNCVEPRKCPRFEFKPQHVNDSSQSNQETDHLVSQTPRPHPLSFKSCARIAASTFDRVSESGHWSHRFLDGFRAAAVAFSPLR